MTTLYVKTHNKTGLKYFGKTQKEGDDIFKYLGSGKYWLNHLKKHGRDISTEIINVFKDDDPFLIEFAIKFSEKHNIVESNEWANLRVENGLDGNPIGFQFSEETLEKFKHRPKRVEYKHSEETKKKIGKANKGKKRTEDVKQKLSEIRIGHEVSKETRKKMSESQKGKIISEETRKKMSESKKGVNKGKTYKEIYGTETPGCGFKRGEENVAKRYEVRKKISEYAKKHNCAFVLKQCPICKKEIGLNNYSRHYKKCCKQFSDDSFWEEW